MTGKPSHAPSGFDPFKSRTDRDIRNQLSEAFTRSLADGNPTYRDRGRKLLAVHEEPARRGYIRDRLAQYDRVWTGLPAELPREPDAVFRSLWRRHLYFECHEFLETLWKAAEGSEKQALQGLIQAAGAFIHLERGKRKPAARLAIKALERLSQHPAVIRRFTDPSQLLADLDAVSQAPASTDASTVTAPPDHDRQD